MLLALACALPAEEAQEDSAPLPPPQASAEPAPTLPSEALAPAGCGGEPPVIGQLREESEWQSFGGEVSTTVFLYTIFVPITDPDADLHHYQLLTAVEPADGDGRVDPALLQLQSEVATPEPCGVPAAEVGLSWMGSEDIGLAWGAPYELAVQIIDAAGLASAPMFHRFCAPLASGELAAGC